MPNGYLIKVNTGKLCRPHADIVDTMIHEMVHAVDFLTNGEWDYTHDGNNPDGEENTPPAVIGDIAEKMAK